MGIRTKTRSRKSDTACTRRFVMEDPMGFHARPAAMFAKTALDYDAEVMVGKPRGHTVNGKSIMGLLTLEALRGDELVVTARGNEANGVLSALERLFATAFGQKRGMLMVVQSVAEPEEACSARGEAECVCA